MMKYCCVWLILILLPLGNQLFGQRQAANWYFGLRCGLDFNSGEPVALIDGNTKANSGTAVISDSITGELLFYTDGRNFWNREHELMQNTHAIPFNCYSEMTQPAIIIPSFSDNNLFHVFCIRPLVEDTPPSNTYDCLNAPVMEGLHENESGLSLFYYLIDMRLNNGLGSVVEDQSNVVIQNNVTEKLTAVPHINGTGYWLLVHGWKNNTFYSRHFEESDLVETVSTNIGSVHGNYGGIYFRDEVEGEMKPSPNGKKIATAVFSEDSLLIFLTLIMQPAD